MMAAVNLTLSLPAEPNIDRWLADKPVGAFIEQLQPPQPLLFETAAIKPLTEQWIRMRLLMYSLWMMQKPKNSIIG